MYNIKTYNGIAEEGLKKFPSEGFKINIDAAPDALVIRSQNMHETAIPDSVLAIGRAGAGVNNIPIDTCSENGIVVFNTPGANANAVKELVLANLLLAARPILHGVQWVNTLDVPESEVAALVEKEKSRFAGTEIFGKKLGVIGLGAIGAMVANDAYRLGMDVIGYDPYVSVDTAWNISSRVKRALTIEEVLSSCDYITIHVPLLPQTERLLNKETFALIKEGAILLNFSRDQLVDTEAVLKVLDSGKLARYITDFAVPELLDHANVLTLPHLGASTEEAEVNCAKMAARTVRNYLEEGTIKCSVNFPTIEMQFYAPTRLAIIHKNVPTMVSSITGELAKHQINIVDMINRSKKDYAYTLIDVEQLTEQALSDIQSNLLNIEHIIRIRVIANKPENIR